MDDLETAGLSTPRAAGIAGIVFAVLFTTALVLMRGSVSLSAQRLADGFGGWLHGSATLVTSYLVPFAGVAFLWFVGVVRDRVGEREDRFFATVFLGSGLLFVAMVFASAGVIAAMLMVPRLLPASAELGRALARALLYIYAARSAGVFTLVTSTIVLRTRAVAAWVGMLGFVVGLVLLLSVQYFDLVILAFPAWVALLSTMILLHQRQLAGQGA